MLDDFMIRTGFAGVGLALAAGALSFALLMAWIVTLFRNAGTQLIPF
jgi:hypothetical protein